MSEADGGLLTRCQEVRRVSKTYFEQGPVSEMQEAYDRFYSRHPAGSKYNTEAYAKRSKFFRPKTRISVRALEAAAAVAGFSTQEFVACAPINKSNKRHRQAAELNQVVMNKRLGQATFSKTSIPWYRIYMAGVQEALVTGVVISKQSWEFVDYEEVTTLTMQDVVTQQVFEREERRRVVEVDRPRVDLIPADRLRIDPAADWSDPINTAGYLVHEIPMRVMEVKERAKRNGRRKWDIPGDDVIRSAMSDDYAALQRSRDAGQDRTEQNDGVDDYAVVWVQEHIHRRPDGSDVLIYVLGDAHLLTGEIPLEDEYPWGRPFAFGSSAIEAHRLYPSGLPKLGAETQDEINNVANLRNDSVTLSMMGRYFYRRGQGVDLRTLLGGTPGSVVGMANINDVKWERPADVTSAAYEEQDRLSLDFDDVTGTMSQSSVMSNKMLNETVGGMNLLQGGQTTVQDYILRTVITTWVEVVLSQLIEMQVLYETDEELVYDAAGAIGIDTETDQGKAEAMELIRIRVKATADVGFGATSPDKRIGKLTMALGAMAQVRPDLLMQADGAEIAKEVFGAVGHDYARFFPSMGSEQQDPRIAQLEQQIAELQKVIETKQVEVQGRVEVAKVAAQGAIERERMKLEAEAEYKRAALHLEERMTANAEMLAAAKTAAERSSLILQREALNKSIFDTEREYVLKLAQLGYLPGVPQVAPMGDVPGKDGPVPLDMSDEATDGEIRTSPPDMAGDDKGGTLARGAFGDVPFAAQ